MSERVLPLLLDARRARTQGPDAIEERQRGRLAKIVAYARAHSPYYRVLYKDLPDQVEDPTLLPVTDKKQLMARFDDWVTDREVTIEKVRPGVFVLDDHTIAVTNALVLRMLGAWFRVTDIFRIIARGAGTTLICATGGHYAEAVAGALLRKRWGDKAIQVVPAQAPVVEMVDQLNRFGPAILAPYASVGALLAREEEAGRLRINPALVVLLAEGLPEGGYDRIANAFNVKVRHSYGATEFPVIAYSCAHGWLHVNSDWVVLEPVDADFQPTPPGRHSHTVLVSNLANRVQPILRYDLGDRILRRPDPCPCGNLLAAIRVEGRTADMLTFSTERGEQVSIPALMFEIVDAMGVELFQIVQTTPTSLRGRFRPAAGADPDRVWRAVHTEIMRVLAAGNLGHVTVRRAEEPPEQSAGGKYRAVIPLT